MAKKKEVEPDGLLAGIIDQLSALEGWEFREVIKGAVKLRKAIKTVEKAEAKRARLAKIQKERKQVAKGLNYEC